MGASRLFDFSRILSVPISYFFEGYSNLDSGDRVAGMAESDESFRHDVTLTRDVVELTRCFQQINDPQVRKRVVELVKSLSPKED